MQIFILIALGTFFFLSVFFYVLYLKTKRKNSELASEVEKKNDNLTTLNKKYKLILEDFSGSNRHGFYDDSLTIISPEDKEKGKTGEKYETHIYVRELDRYTNGTSKIEITNMEVFSGFDGYQYEWIKTSLRRRFSSIRKTSDIEWLESEEHIKELRREKLEKIKNAIKQK